MAESDVYCNVVMNLGEVKWLTQSPQNKSEVW